MRRFTPSLAAVATMLGLVVYAAPAQAQATRTWVSGVGDDVNPCSRTAPCKTFAGAISKTAAAGEISCLDPGGFGSVTIVKSLTISCEYTEGGIVAALTTGVIINAGAADIVFLSGLNIQGAGNGVNGIRFVAGGSLHVRKTIIRGFNGAGTGSGNGISFTPSGASELYVTDSTIVDNGGPSDSAGIQIAPTGGGSAKVLVDNTHMDNNVNGFRATGVGSSGGIRATVRNSTAAGNSTNGVTGTSPGGAVISLFVERTAAVNNSNGIVSDGNQSFVNISANVVTSNANGLVITNSATLASYLNNFVDGNTASQGASNSSLTPLK